MSVPVRILHVVESYGAGVASAVDQYVDSTPQFEHHLLRRVRPGQYLSGSSESAFASVQELPSGHWASFGAVRRRVAALDVAVIHAHSSIAGAYTRLALRSSRRRRIVYTPHCFAFERRDQGLAVRGAFYLAEWMLSLNTNSIAACSEREAKIGKRMASGKSVYVPNTSGFLPSEKVRPGRESSVLRLVTMGRISPQKDPVFFIEMLRHLRCTIPDIQVVWIGAGTREDETLLRNNGIEVTGWMARDATAQQLKDSDIYVHCAAWEGFPLALLDAHQLGLPIVARKIPALAFSPQAPLAVSPEQVAALVFELQRGGSDALQLNWSQWQDTFSANTAAVQSSRLREAYSLSGDDFSCPAGLDSDPVRIFPMNHQIKV